METKHKWVYIRHFILTLFPRYCTSILPSVVLVVSFRFHKIFFFASHFTLHNFVSVSTLSVRLYAPVPHIFLHFHSVFLFMCKGSVSVYSFWFYSHYENKRPPQNIMFSDRIICRVVETLLNLTQEQVAIRVGRYSGRDGRLEGRTKQDVPSM